MGERVILWNEGRFCKTPEIMLVAPEARCSRDEAERYFAESKALQYVVILAELCWDGRRFSDLYGLDFLCRLRMEYRLTCPVVVCSFMPETFMLRKFSLLADFSSNHPFLQLPQSTAAIINRARNGVPLDEPRLNHVIVNCCDPSIRIHRHLTHGRGFQVIYRGGSMSNLTQSFLSDCESDLQILKNYLKCPVLGDVELTLANAFMNNLGSMLKEGDVNAMLELKASLQELSRVVA
jgi:hypothetical protein